MAEDRSVRQAAGVVRDMGRRRFGGAEAGKPKHYWEPQANLDERIHKLPNGHARTVEAQNYLDMAPVRPIP